MTRISFIIEEKYTLTGEGLVYETPEELAQMQPHETVRVYHTRFDEDWMAEMYESGFGPGVAVFLYEVIDAVFLGASESQA